MKIGELWIVTQASTFCCTGRVPYGTTTARHTGSHSHPGKVKPVTRAAPISSGLEEESPLSQSAKPAPPGARAPAQLLPCSWEDAALPLASVQQQQLVVAAAFLERVWKMGLQLKKELKY